ncbi:hypothetical protein ACP70R_031566 [Stipagrostis hirtigluma subsp. patula]
MARRKVSMGLIANRRVRAATYAKRKEGLKKKAAELATLCDVPVALVCSCPDAGAGAGAAADVWESREGVLAAYRALPAEARAGHTLRAYVEGELGKEEAKLARVRQSGPAELAPWDPALDDLAAEELHRLLTDTIDAALRAVSERRRALGLPQVDDDDVGGALLEREGVALDVSDAVPLARAAPCAGTTNFADADGCLLPEQSGDGVHTGDGRYEQAMWGSAAMMHPVYGFQQCNSSADMDPGYLLQTALDNNGRRLPWDAFQQRNAGATMQYGFQCDGSSSRYMGVNGYLMQTVPGNGGGAQPNLAMWATGEPCTTIVPAGYPSLDLGLSYMDTPAAHASQDTSGSSLAMGAGANFVDAPPALSLTMGTGGDFVGALPARPIAMSFGGDMMNAGSYITPWPAQQHQDADGSHQSGLEQLHYPGDLEETHLHYLSDMEDTQLQLWGTNPPSMRAPHPPSKKQRTK